MSGTAPPVDLRPDHWTIVRDVLRLHIPDRKVLAFGSRATWTAKDYSDLDLAILGDGILPLNIASALAAGFSESDLPFKVDLVEWASLDEAFRDIICRDGVEVQGFTNTTEATRCSPPEHVDAASPASRTSTDTGRRLVTGEWHETTLGDVLTLKRGYDLPSRKRTDGLIPVVSSSGITDHHVESRVSGPGVVIGRYGTLGQVFFIRGDFWPLNTSLYVHDFKGNDPQFISYFLRALDFSAYSDKAAVPGLNRNHLHQNVVQIPTNVTNQRAIAFILGSLDDKIELNRRMNETLEAMARAIFKDWFVDFGPVRAKVEGRDTGFPRHISDLFPDGFVDSELGEAPDGWEVRPLPDLIAVNPQRRLRKGEIAPYLDMANMPVKGHVPASVVNRRFGSGMRFLNGDTLVARITPCFENGKTAYVDFLRAEQVGWGSTEYIVLCSKPPIPSEFAYCLARSTRFRQFAIQSMTGTSGRQRVQAKALDQFMLACPTGQVAVAFGTLVRPIMSRVSAAARETQSLANLRDALLPKLMSGEICFRAAEKIVEAVA